MKTQMQTNSEPKSKTSKIRLLERGYKETQIEETLAEVKFEGRTLKNKPKGK